MPAATGSAPAWRARAGGPFSPAAAARGASASPPEPAQAGGAGCASGGAPMPSAPWRSFLAGVPGGAPAPVPSMQTLRHRRDFLAAKAGPRWRGSLLALQSRRRVGSGPSDAAGEVLRVGYTASRKGVGGAVERNRAKRRLRAAVHEVAAREPALLLGGCDYVFLANQETPRAPWPQLRGEVRAALLAVAPRLRAPSAARGAGGGKRRDTRGPKRRDKRGAGLAARGGRLVLLAPVYLWRYVLAAFFPPACRFEPSCSHYAEEALRRHGALCGSFLAARRLLRCRPGGPSGYDPVPQELSRIPPPALFHGLRRALVPLRLHRSPPRVAQRPQ